MKPKNIEAGKGVSAPAGLQEILSLNLATDNSKRSDSGDASTKRCVVASTDSAGLWRQVAKNAEWGACKVHGTIARPRLVKVRFCNDTLHVRALCPACNSSLGFLPQQKRFLSGTGEQQKAAFLAYLKEARANGHRPGQAYYRFKAAYGRPPESIWNQNDGGGV